jgi:sulfate adenylyltransferase subunit 1
MSTVVRLATAGSVDDGKSTLVGRLLHDTHALPEDQWEAVRAISSAQGLDTPDLALITDGLRAERDQGITIDVAYRYFATERRSFVLADCPGHVQYTRNTVTGVSTADALVVLVNARTGVVEQTRRHLAVAALLRVAHVVVAVNKIDLVDFDPEALATVNRQVERVTDRLGIADVRTVPVCALHGDNVVRRSARTPGYEGPTLLALLEELPAAKDRQAAPFRMPVQLVIRPQQAAARDDLTDYRGYAGQVLSGAVTIGDEVVVLPSGVRSTVTAVDRADRPCPTAHTGQAVTLRLSDDLDVARGDLIAEAARAPVPVREIETTVCWLAERPVTAGDRFLVKHGTRMVRAVIAEVNARLDVTDLHAEPATELRLNDLGQMRLRLAEALPVEPYTRNRGIGAFLLIDAHDGATVAAGLVADADREPWEVRR